MTEKAQIVEVIQVVSNEGDGTPESPARLVTSYFSKEGELIARFDPAVATMSKRVMATDCKMSQIRNPGI